LLIKPVLPHGIDTMEIQGMKVRGENVHLRLTRVGDTVKIHTESDNYVEVQVL